MSWEGKMDLVLLLKGPSPVIRTGVPALKCGTLGYELKGDLWLWSTEQSSYYLLDLFQNVVF